MQKLKVNGIVGEEVQNFVKNSIVSDDRLHFKQRFNNSEFYNYKSFSSEFDSKIIASDIIISWSVSFQVNQSGIQKFVIDVYKVEGMFTVALHDKHTDEQKQETTKNISEFDWKFIVDNGVVLPKDGQLTIKDLKFEFNQNNCIVRF